MKEEDLEDVNKVICKFIQDMSLHQDTLLTEAPDVWGCILSSMSMLSDVSVFLEAVKYHEHEEELNLYNSFARANGLPEKKSLKVKNSKNNIDLSKYLNKTGGSNVVR